MFCTKCGAEIKQGVSYCIQCGQPVVGKENLLDNEKDKIKKLEEQYQSLLKAKQQENQAKLVIYDIKNLHKEIDDLLKDAERLDSRMKNIAVEQSTVDNDDLIEYCPECGFYVGKSMFCARCGRKIREWEYGRN